MTIKQFFQRLYVAFFFALAAFAVLAVLLFLNQRELQQSQRVRLQSYQLADELRQSSDDLTRFARTYVATGDPGTRLFTGRFSPSETGKNPAPSTTTGFTGISWRRGTRRL